MLGSECQLNDDSIIQNLENLEVILGEDDITTIDFQNLEAINDIAIPDSDDLEATLNGNDIVQASNDLSTTPDNAISSTTEALDNARDINGIANQSSISSIYNKPTQTQDKASQNSIIDKAEPSFSSILQQAHTAIFDSDTDNLQEGSATQALSNLATVLKERDITSLDSEAILDENYIRIPDFQGLEAVLCRADSQNSISSTHNQDAQFQDNELQSNIASKAKPDFDHTPQQALATVYNDCVQELQVTYNDCISKLQAAYNNVNKFQADTSLPNRDDSQFSNIKSGNSKETQGLLRPVTKGKDLKIVKKLLHSGADINERDSSDDSQFSNIKSGNSKETKGLLHSAIKSKDLKTVKKLLHSGADINERDNSNNTPLHIAVQRNNIDMLNTLLGFSPDIELQNNQGSTPLHSAISRICVGIAKLLLKYGANTNAQDNKGNTVLHKIINSKSDRTTLSLEPILENKNTDLNIKNNRGESFINIVLSKFEGLNHIDKKEFIRRLNPIWKRYSKLNNESRLIIKGNRKLNAVIEKCRNKALQTYGCLINSVKLCSAKEEIIEILRLRGVKINDKNLNGKTLLHKAVNEPFSLKVIKMLLDIGYDVNAQNNRGNTALHIIASYDKRLAITKVLLNCGANVNLQNVSKQTPLYIAAARSSTSTLEILLNSSDIDPNKQDTLGNTALHHALKSKMPFQTTELLLKNDTVNLNIKNKEGQCFVSIILDKFKGQNNKEQNNKYLVELLVKSYDRLSDKSKLIIKGNSKFYVAVEKRRKRLIPYNVLSQPSSSSLVNEFLNIAK
ncbi:ankyrin repeat domain-containing protein [Candidatus Mesenet endosymbiont of Agriotes lineatus]|uniref:ankyrin repeat domain-containing protein n=1 Tax=Candidatus Mesenet endosymbiont of Agriotes lineatus TaxID=3077948 RepID=UPI0030D5F2C5